MKITVVYPKGQFGDEVEHQFTFDVPEIKEETPILNALDYIYRIMNVVNGAEYEMPQKLNCRSMCMGDYVILNGKKYLCEIFGWLLIENGKTVKVV